MAGGCCAIRGTLLFGVVSRDEILGRDGEAVMQDIKSIYLEMMQMRLWVYNTT